MSARWAGAAGSAARGGGAGDQHHHVYFCGPRVRAKHPWHVDRLQQTRCRNRQPDSHLAAPVNDLQRGGQHCEDRVGSRRRSGLGLRRLGRTLGRRSRGEREDATRPRALVAREVLQEPQAVAIKTAKSSLLQARGNHANSLAAIAAGSRQRRRSLFEDAFDICGSRAPEFETTAWLGMSDSNWRIRPRAT